MTGAFKLKAPVMLAMKSDLAEIHVDDACWYALICKDALFSIDAIASTLPVPVTNLLQEFRDVFPSNIPPGLSPICRIEHQIDLILEASLPNRATYRANPEETKEIVGEKLRQAVEKWRGHRSLQNESKCQEVQRESPLDPLDQSQIGSWAVI